MRRKRIRATSTVAAGIISLTLAFGSVVQASVTAWYPNSVPWGFRGSAPTTSPPSGKKICYRAHLTNTGWQAWKCDGQIAGGTANKIEAIQIFSAHDAEAQVQLQSIGWTQHLFIAPNGRNNYGTTGENRRLEALAIETPYAVLGGFPSHRVCGRANVQGLGWLAQDCATGQTGPGQPHGIAVLGTFGQSRAMYSFWLTVT
jgi:hypothetical protein